MRNVQSVKDTVIALKKGNGKLTKTDQETADLLSAYFKEVYTVEDITNIPMATATAITWEDTNLEFSTYSNEETTTTENGQITGHGRYSSTTAKRMCNCSSKAAFVDLPPVVQHRDSARRMVNSSHCPNIQERHQN